MKWLLVWWMIHPWHAQVMHIEKYGTEDACRHAADSIQVPAGKQIRWHCSQE